MMHVPPRRLQLAAGEVRQIQIAVNGIARAPTFTHIPYVLVSGVSDNRQRLAGVYGTFQSPFWVWDKHRWADFPGRLGIPGRDLRQRPRRRRLVGRRRGHTVRSDCAATRRALDQGSGLEVDREQPVRGLRRSSIRCIFDLSNDGSTAVGLAFVDCVNAYAFKWTAKTGMTLLPKTSEEQQCDDLYGGGAYRCEGTSRANAVSGSGKVVGGWEEIPEVGSFRVGSIWQGNQQHAATRPERQQCARRLDRRSHGGELGGHDRRGFPIGVASQGRVHMDAGRMA